MKKKRNTILLTAAILAVAFGCFLVQRVFLRTEGASAVVLSHGVQIARMPLSQDAVLPVGDARQGYNRIRTEDGYVFVEEADCPDKICVREGRKRYAKETITCLPHELIIIVEAQDAGKVDAVAR